jgi:hypothetical protein
MTKLLLPLLLVGYCSVSMAAQSAFSGLWKGVITQDAGGYRPQYNFELYLQQKGSRITGRSYAYVDKIYVVLELRGELLAHNKVRITETRIVDSRRVQGLGWCLKTYELTIIRQGSKLQLKGPWVGMADGAACIPGMIILTYKAARA